MRGRFVMGLFIVLLSLGFVLSVVIAVDGRGAVSKSEWLPMAWFYVLLMLVASIWAWWRGDYEDMRDRQPRPPVE